MRKILKKFLMLPLVLLSICLLTACDDVKTRPSEDNPSKNEIILGDDNKSRDDNMLVGLDLRDLDLRNAEYVGLDLRDLELKSLELYDLELVDLELVDIELEDLDEEFIELIAESFVQSYPEYEFHYEENMENLMKGTAIMLVYFGVSKIGIPGVSTFCGVVFSSEFSIGAIAISAAIDGALGAYEAYKETGDYKLALSNSLNGIADGYKYGALIAPLTVAGGKAGGEALNKYVGQRLGTKLSRDIASKEVTKKSISKSYKYMPKFVEQISKLDDFSSKSIKTAFNSLEEPAKKTINLSVFKALAENKDILFNSLKSVKHGSVAEKIRRELQKDFLRKSNLAEEAIENTSNKLFRKTLHSFDDISDDQVREYAQKHVTDFVELYSNKLSSRFVDASIKSAIEDDKVIKSLDKIMKRRGSYFDLLEEVGDSQLLNKIFGGYGVDAKEINSEVFDLMKIKYGERAFENFMNSQKIVQICAGTKKDLDSNVVVDIAQNIIKGKYKALKDIPNKDIRANLSNNPEAIANALKFYDGGRVNKDLITTLYNSRLYNVLSKDYFDETIISNITSGKLTKEKILNDPSGRGKIMYEKLLENKIIVLEALNHSGKEGNSLAKSILEDVIKTNNISSTEINNLLRAISLKNINFGDDTLRTCGNAIAEYYKGRNPKLYHEFNELLAEIRSDYANKQFPNAGMMDRAGKLVYSGNKYIDSKYGPIKYTKAGYPIFDDFAVARVEIKNLTGDYAADIAKANKIHHGNSNNVPGYSWHHLEDGKTMILIPREVHDKTLGGLSHKGGASLLRGGLKAWI